MLPTTSTTGSSAQLQQRNSDAEPSHGISDIDEITYPYSSTDTVSRVLKHATDTLDSIMKSFKRILDSGIDPNNWNPVETEDSDYNLKGFVNWSIWRINCMVRSANSLLPLITVSDASRFISASASVTVVKGILSPMLRRAKLDALIISLMISGGDPQFINRIKKMLWLLSDVLGEVNGLQNEGCFRAHRDLHSSFDYVIQSAYMVRESLEALATITKKNTSARIRSLLNKINSTKILGSLSENSDTKKVRVVRFAYLDARNVIIETVRAIDDSAVIDPKLIPVADSLKSIITGPVTSQAHIGDSTESISAREVYNDLHSSKPVYLTTEDNNTSGCERRMRRRRAKNIRSTVHNAPVMDHIKKSIKEIQNFIPHKNNPQTSAEKENEDAKLWKKCAKNAESIVDCIDNLLARVTVSKESGYIIAAASVSLVQNVLSPMLARAKLEMCKMRLLAIGNNNMAGKVEKMISQLSYVAEKVSGIKHNRCFCHRSLAYSFDQAVLPAFETRELLWSLRFALVDDKASEVEACLNKIWALDSAGPFSQDATPETVNDFLTSYLDLRNSIIDTVSSIGHKDLRCKDDFIVVQSYKKIIIGTLGTHEDQTLLRQSCAVANARTTSQEISTRVTNVIPECQRNRSDLQGK